MVTNSPLFLPVPVKGNKLKESLTVVARHLLVISGQYQLKQSR